MVFNVLGTENVEGTQDESVEKNENVENGALPGDFNQCLLSTCIFTLN